MRKIWCLGIASALLAGLVVGVLPASAGTLELSREDIPSTHGLKRTPTPGMNILDIAAASNGTTIYAATGTGGGVAGQKLYKSNDGGFTWSAIITPNNAAADAINLVAVAPDNKDIVAVGYSSDEVATFTVTAAGAGFTGVIGARGISGTTSKSSSKLAYSFSNSRRRRMPSKGTGSTWLQVPWQGTFRSIQV